MEILTLRSPEAPEVHVRLYRLYYIRLTHMISYAVVKHEWAIPLSEPLFQPPSSIIGLQTEANIGNWYRELQAVLNLLYPYRIKRAMYDQYGADSLAGIVKLISADNPGWIALTDCSTDMVLRHFLLRRPPAVENRPTLSETLRTTEAAMRGLAATVSAVAPSMEVGLDGLWELARALQLPERVLDGQYKGSFSTDSLRFEVRKPENIADTVDDLREASETAKKYLAEREAEEERLRALRDEEARKPPTRSGSIEQ